MLFAELIVVVGVISATLSAVIVGWTRKRAAEWRLIDIPNSRSIHTRATPRGGGIGIVTAMVTASLFVGGLGYVPWPELRSWVASVAMIAVISVWDDVTSLPQVVRIAVHGLAAAGFLMSVGFYEVISVPFVGAVDLGGLGWWLAWMWLVSFTNVFNFMDGADGFAGSVGAIAGAAWVLIAGYASVPSPGLFGMAIAGACLGFLVHNWMPARIFMGDVGSAALGFSLAALPLLDESRIDLPFAGVLVVWPFLFDATFTILQRLCRGESIFRAHRSHLYQRLILAGWSHRQVSTVYCCFGIATAASAIWWLGTGPAREFVGVAVPICGAVVLVCLVRWAESRQVALASSA